MSSFSPLYEKGVHERGEQLEDGRPPPFPAGSCPRSDLLPVKEYQRMELARDM